MARSLSLSSDVRCCQKWKDSCPAALQADAHVLQHRQVREHGGNLERADDAHAGNLRRRAPVMSRPLNRIWPEVGHQEFGQQVEAGGLAGAVRADQRVDMAALHFQVHVIDRGENLELLGQFLVSRMTSAIVSPNVVLFEVLKVFRSYTGTNFCSQYSITTVRFLIYVLRIMLTRKVSFSKLCARWRHHFCRFFGNHHGRRIGCRR
jgi:hypothetical protein